METNREVMYSSKEGKEVFEKAVKNLTAKSKIKHISDKWTDLGNLLKDNLMKVFVYRTTMRPVAPRAGGFRFHKIKTMAPVLLFSKGYDPKFEEKKQDLLDKFTMIKARLEFEKLNEANRNQYPSFGNYIPNRVISSLDPNIKP